MPTSVRGRRPFGAGGAVAVQSIGSEQQWRYPVTTAGDHAYVCTFHPTMRGQLVAR